MLHIQRCLDTEGTHQTLWITTVIRQLRKENKSLQKANLNTEICAKNDRHFRLQYWKYSTRCKKISTHDYISHFTIFKYEFSGIKYIHNVQLSPPYISSPQTEILYLWSNYPSCSLTSSSGNLFFLMNLPIVIKVYPLHFYLWLSYNMFITWREKLDLEWPFHRVRLILDVSAINPALTLH